MYNMNKVEEDLIDIARLVAKYYGNKIVIVGHISMLLQYKDSYRHTSDVDFHPTDASVFEELSDTIEDKLPGYFGNYSKIKILWNYPRLVIRIMIITKPFVTLSIHTLKISGLF